MLLKVLFHPTIHYWPKLSYKSKVCDSEIKDRSIQCFSCRLIQIANLPNSPPIQSGNTIMSWCRFVENIPDNNQRTGKICVMVWRAHTHFLFNSGWADSGGADKRSCFTNIRFRECAFKQPRLTLGPEKCCGSWSDYRQRQSMFASNCQCYLRNGTGMFQF